MNRKISKNSLAGRITNRDLKNILLEELRKKEKKDFLNEGIDELLQENFFQKIGNFFKSLFGDSSKVITAAFKKSVPAIDKTMVKGVEEVSKIFAKLESPEQAIAIAAAMNSIEEDAKNYYQRTTKDSITSIANEGMETKDATAIVGLLMQIAHPTVDPMAGIRLTGWKSIKQSLEIASKAKKKTDSGENEDSDGDGQDSLSVDSDTQETS